MTHGRFFTPSGRGTFLLALLSLAAMTVTFPGQRSTEPSVPGRFLALLVLVAAVVVMALLRVSRPLLTLLIETGIYPLASTLGAEPGAAVPYLAALHSCMARGCSRHVALGAASPLVLAGALLVVPHPGSDGSLLWAGRAALVICAVMTGLMTRMWLARQESRSDAEHERQRADELAAQRDRAVEREQLAIQLHDSVGHCLTTIAALSEGLAGFSAEPEYLRAVQGIGQLAREGLGETRRVVKTLNTDPPDHRPAMLRPEEPAQEPRDASPKHPGIDDLLGTVRATGVTVDFTEKGDITALHDTHLCFALTREALTNCLRHATGLTRIAVSWEHGKNGTTWVRVEDDGTAGPPGMARTGTGLTRYRVLILGRGGRFHAGPTDSGWLVDARIVPRDETDQVPS